MAVDDRTGNVPEDAYSSAVSVKTAEEEKCDEDKVVQMATETISPEKIENLSPIDSLYKMAGKEGFKEGHYQVLINLLSRINGNIINPSEAIKYEYPDTSHLAATRASTERGRDTRTYKKNKLYGVVVKSVIEANYRYVYIDVPPWNTNLINHPDDIATLKPDQLGEYKHLIFYPESRNFTPPAPLRIAIVEVPENFPNHTNSNPQDAVYKGLYDEAQIISSSTKQPKIQATKDSTLPTTNSKPKGKTKKFTMFTFKTDYDSIIKEASAATGVPEDWIKVFIAVETGFTENAKSPTGVKGIMQTTQATFNQMAKDSIFKNKFSDTPDRKKPEHSIYAGSLYLKYLSKLFHNDIRKVSAAYNSGPGNVGGTNWEEKLRPEGKNYIKKINAAFKELEAFKRFINQGTEQSTPVAQQTENNSQTGKTASLAVNKPKMLLVNFQVDTAKNTSVYNRGSSVIKIREDIAPDLKEIKKILNNYDIPFTCNSLNIELGNKNLSDLARVGLEINLNINSGMTKDSTEDDIYYICPDTNNNLRIYVQARKNLEYLEKKYTPENRQLDIYNIRNTYLKRPPELKKIFKPVLDLTKIFQDFGFYPVKPEYLFFSKSDNVKSNWFIFYKPSKINIGYTYKELLSTVYYNNNEQIWDVSNKRWDGKKFS